MVVPLLALPGSGYDGRTVLAFLLPAAGMGGLGLLLRRRHPPATEAAISIQEGGVIVLLSWVLVCLFSAVPFLVTPGMSFTQAVFESVSGWTTTGLSVADVTTAGDAVLLWRSTMQLAGGAGLAIIMLSAIAGPTGPALSVAEGREQLVPQVRRSAKLVLAIYASYVVAGWIALDLAGMSTFDAINHSFAALSTGGFSTRPASIGHWDSVAVEAVILPLMILGNLSFVTAWLLLRGKWRAAGRNGEVRLMAVLLLVCTLLLFLLTARELYSPLGKCARVAVFETVTALTTTGFSTVGYGDWNAFGFVVLIVLMIVGGGTCSTAGGVKQFRIHLLWKSVWWDVRRSLLPRTAVTSLPIWEGERKGFLDADRLRRAGSFLFLYCLALAVGTGVLAAHGYGLRESAFEFASALGTVGLSVGITSPSAPPGDLWTEILGMLLGRLEFLVIFAGAAKLTRDLPRVIGRGEAEERTVPGGPR
jgi:trk system potassium uptake protein TrkH